MTRDEPSADPGLRRNAKVEEAPLQDELMLFDPDTSRFFVLNRTMAFLWRRCDGRAGIAEVADAMVSAFAGADRAAVEADLRRAAHELTSHGLLHAAHAVDAGDESG